MSTKEHAAYLLSLLVFGLAACHDTDSNPAHSVVEKPPVSTCASQYLSAAEKRASAQVREELIGCLDRRAITIEQQKRTKGPVAPPAAVKRMQNLASERDEELFLSDLLGFTIRHRHELGSQRVYDIAAAVHVIADAHHHADVASKASRRWNEIVNPSAGARFERRLEQTIAMGTSPEFAAAVIIGGGAGRLAGSIARGRGAALVVVRSTEVVTTQLTGDIVLSAATNGRTAIYPNPIGYAGTGLLPSEANYLLGAYLAVPAADPIHRELEAYRARLDAGPANVHNQLWARMCACGSPMRESAGCTPRLCLPTAATE